MVDLPECDLLHFNYVDLTLGEEGETFTEECSHLKVARLSLIHELSDFLLPRGFLSQLLWMM